MEWSFLVAAPGWLLCPDSAPGRGYLKGSFFFRVHRLQQRGAGTGADATGGEERKPQPRRGVESRQCRVYRQEREEIRCGAARDTARGI